MAVSSKRLTDDDLRDVIQLVGQGEDMQKSVLRVLIRRTMQDLAARLRNCSPYFPFHVEFTSPATSASTRGGTGKMYRFQRTSPLAVRRTTARVRPRLALWKLISRRG